MGDYQEQFNQCQTVNECLKLKQLLSNSGEILEIKNSLSSASSEEKRIMGQKLGQLRQDLQEIADARILKIQAEQEKDNFLDFDPTFYSKKYLNTQKGSANPLSLVMDEVVEIFSQMGFDTYNGPLITSQYDNFSSVNLPDYHPARDMQDTFFTNKEDKNGENYVLRTQVTANIIPYVKNHKPPFRVIFPGIVFRNENMDATHDINFTQFDMWLVDKKTSNSQLLTLIQNFFSQFFQTKNIKVRLRPSFFPFTEPSFEGDISCPFCSTGCRICKHTKWIEVFGAGPVHRNVIQNMGLDPEKYQGLAFGFGLDRLAQMKFHVTSGGQFYNADLGFLKGK